MISYPISSCNSSGACYITAPIPVTWHRCINTVTSLCSSSCYCCSYGSGMHGVSFRISSRSSVISSSTNSCTCQGLWQHLSVVDLVDVCQAEVEGLPLLVIHSALQGRREGHQTPQNEFGQLPYLSIQVSLQAVIWPWW